VRTLTTLAAICLATLAARGGEQPLFNGIVLKTLK
jgi:hypothetical protein